MTGSLEQIRLGYVRAVDELVSGFLVLGSGVVLHYLANDSTFGVKYGKTRTNLFRERK
jgi:hypothetical protein